MKMKIACVQTFFKETTITFESHNEWDFLKLMVDSIGGTVLSEKEKEEYRRLKQLIYWRDSQ